jgi:O-antigen/teichoic acid export membrane protein
VPSLLRNIIGSSVVLLAGRIISKLATIGVTIVIARELGVDLFGSYSAVVALTAISGLVSDFGLVLPSIRSISARREDGHEIISESVSVRLFWSVVSIPLTIGAGLLLNLSPLLVFLFTLSSVLETITIALIRMFEGVNNIRSVTLYTIVERLIFCIAVMVSVSWFKSIYSVAVAYCISFSAMLAIMIMVVGKEFGTISIHISASSVKRLTNLGSPFLATALFSTLFYRIDIFLLSAMRTPAEVGIYNAALRITDAQTFIPAAVMASVYPVLSRLHSKNDQLSFLELVKKIFFVFVLLGIVMAVILYWTAPAVTGLLYPLDFSGASDRLRIISMMSPFYFVNFLLSQSLVAMHREVIFTRMMLAVAALSFILNLMLIPQFGSWSSACIRVCSEVLLTVSLGVVFWKINKKNFGTHRRYEDKGDSPLYDIQTTDDGIRR